MAQDKLGVLIGLDEGCARARISRYETGAHQPPFHTAKLLSEALGVPVAYFYCEDDWLAEAIRRLGGISAEQQRKVGVWLDENT